MSIKESIISVLTALVLISMVVVKGLIEEWMKEQIPRLPSKVMAILQASARPPWRLVTYEISFFISVICLVMFAYDPAPLTKSYCILISLHTILAWHNAGCWVDALGDLQK